MARIEGPTRLRIDAPTLRPERGGLLPVATVVTGTDPAWMDHGVRFQMDLEGNPVLVPTDGSDKVFNQNPEDHTADPFSVYLGAEYSLFQHGMAADQIKDLYERSKGHMLEQEFQRTILEPRAVDLTPFVGDPITNLKYAVGVLEQWIGERYRGLPTLHASRLGASIMTEMVTNDSTWTLHTTQGTPVANGAGYKAPVTPSGATWLYITGEVFVFEGEVFYSGEETPDLKRNRDLALAEATYMLMAPGPIAKILVGSTQSSDTVIVGS